jgi:anti-sigma factor RsiW
MKFDQSMLSAYLDGELTPEEEAVVQKQLATSPADRELLASLSSLQTQLSGLPTEAFRSDPVAEVRRRIARESTRPAAGPPDRPHEDQPAVASSPGGSSPAPRPPVAQQDQAPQGVRWAYAAIALASAASLLGVMAWLGSTRTLLSDRGERVRSAARSPESSAAEPAPAAAPEPSRRPAGSPDDAPIASSPPAPAGEAAPAGGAPDSRADAASDLRPQPSAENGLAGANEPSSRAAREATERNSTATAAADEAAAAGGLRGGGGGPFGAGMGGGAGAGASGVALGEAPTQLYYLDRKRGLRPAETAEDATAEGRPDPRAEGRFVALDLPPANRDLVLRFLASQTLASKAADAAPEPTEPGNAGDQARPAAATRAARDATAAADTAGQSPALRSAADQLAANQSVAILLEGDAQQLADLLRQLSVLSSSEQHVASAAALSVTEQEDAPPRGATNYAVPPPTAALPSASPPGGEGMPAELELGPRASDAVRGGRVWLLLRP